MSEQLSQIFEMMLTLDRKFTTFAQQAGYEFDKEGNATRVGNPSGLPEKTKRFNAPTRCDVYKYFVDEKGMRENLATTEAEKFVDFYNSKNWMVGKNKMSVWKGSAANWAKTALKDVAKESPKRYSFQELARGDHLEVLQQQPAQIESNPSYVDDFKALELENKRG